MALKFFVYGVLIFSSYFLIGNVEAINPSTSINNDVVLSFDEATMYTINQEKVTRIVNAKSVLRYKTKDVMYDAEITLSNKDKNIKDIMYADIMIKKGDKYSFLNNASFTRSDFIYLNSDEFFYNSKNGIITNTKKYEGIYYNNTIKAKNIYFDSINNKFKSNNVHFEIDIKDN